MPSPTLDLRTRPLRSLRLSVTDRCNLRCGYCMPEDHYVWLPKRDILDFDELVRVARLFADLGVDRLRITGGEPLIRTDLDVLVGLLAEDPRIRDLALTTNAVLLPRFGEALRSAGLQRVTISLDSLDRQRFAELAGRDELPATLAGIDAARELGFADIKLNTVVLAGRNDHEIPDLLAFARERGIELRLIEYMDVGGATAWSPERVCDQRQMLQRIEERFGAVETLPGRGSAPAARFRLDDGTVFGIIASTTQPFCGACDRSRVTADGMWFTCLYATGGINLRDAMRAAASDEELRQLLQRRWQQRDDRGAERRLEQRARGRLHEPETLRDNPHLEMHTRGG